MMGTHALGELGNFAYNDQGQPSAGGSCEGTEVAPVNDSAFCDNFLLEDIDTYWDDVSTLFTLSRMVDASVLKGTINAIVQDAAEKIASKDAEIEMLKERIERLESSRSAAGSSNYSSSPQSGPMSKKLATSGHSSHIDLHMEGFASDSWGSLKLVSKDHLWSLRNEIEHLRNLHSTDAQVCSACCHSKVPENLLKLHGSIASIEAMLETIFEQVGNTHFLFMDTIHEQQWRREFEKEVDTIAIQNFVQSLQGVFNSRFCQEKSLKVKLVQAVNDISNMRDELVVISNSLSGFEAGYLSHSSHEKTEERNSHHRKDNGAHKILSNHAIPPPDHEISSNGIDGNKKPDPEVDLSLLSHMSKEELVTHYKTEMTKMKRNHELALHEKTEEIFILKREILREKGSSSIRKDREYELLRKRIMEFISKLNLIVQETSMTIHVQSETNEFCILQDHVNSILAENLRLKSLLSDKRKEVKKLSSQISNVENQITRQSTVEMKFLHQIKKLKWDIEDERIEANLRDEISKIVFRNCACEAELQLDALVMENTFLADFYSIILGGSISDAEAVLNTEMARYNEEKGLLISEISRKEKVLDLELRRANKLKDDLDMEIKLKEEKERLAQEMQLTLMQHEQKSHATFQEMSLLRQQIDEQNRMTAVYEKEVDLLNDRLNYATNQIHQLELEVRKLKTNLEVALSNCLEAERQKDILCENIQKERDRISSIIVDRELQKKDTNNLLVSTLDLSKALAEFESKVTESIQAHSSRLLNLKCQWEPMTQLVDTLKSQILWYKQNLETKSSNLQKAENEVDLLGDEVDTLLGILAKMYIALDHYSPVLQHYPGVMEILKLVRRELEGSARAV